MDLLANDWDADLLPEWGVNIDWGGVEVESEQLSDTFTLPDGDKEPYQQMTFTLADEQAICIKDAIALAKEDADFDLMETFGNSNSNGNALAYIIQQWEELRK